MFHILILQKHQNLTFTERIHYKYKNSIAESPWPQNPAGNYVERVKELLSAPTKKRTKKIE
jgi:hypothetical protein